MLQLADIYEVLVYEHDLLVYVHDLLVYRGRYNRQALHAILPTTGYLPTQV